MKKLSVQDQTRVDVVSEILALTQSMIAQVGKDKNEAFLTQMFMEFSVKVVAEVVSKITDTTIQDNITKMHQKNQIIEG